MFFDFLFSSLQRKSSEQRRFIFASDTPTITIPNQEIKDWLVDKLMRARPRRAGSTLLGVELYQRIRQDLRDDPDSSYCP